MSPRGVCRPCAARARASTVAASSGGLAVLELGAKLDRIEHASRAHAWRAECEAATATEADARETFGLLAELRPILAAAEGATAPPEAKQELDRGGITWARLRKSMGRDKP